MANSGMRFSYLLILLIAIPSTIALTKQTTIQGDGTICNFIYSGFNKQWNCQESTVFTLDVPIDDICTPSCDKRVGDETLSTLNKLNTCYFDLSNCNAEKGTEGSIQDCRDSKALLSNENGNLKRQHSDQVGYYMLWCLIGIIVANVFKSSKYGKDLYDTIQNRRR